MGYWASKLHIFPHTPPLFPTIFLFSVFFFDFSSFFNFTLKRIIPVFEIGNAELDERNQYITYHNISVTVSFLMRLNEFDEPNHMSIARDDCLAYFNI